MSRFAAPRRFHFFLCFATVVIVSSDVVIAFMLCPLLSIQSLCIIWKWEPTPRDDVSLNLSLAFKTENQFGELHLLLRGYTFMCRCISFSFQARIFQDRAMQWDIDSWVCENADSISVYNANNMLYFYGRQPWSDPKNGSQGDAVKVLAKSVWDVKEYIWISSIPALDWIFKKMRLFLVFDVRTSNNSVHLSVSESRSCRMVESFPFWKSKIDYFSNRII